MTLLDNTPARLAGFSLVDEDLDQHSFRVQRSSMVFQKTL